MPPVSLPRFTASLRNLNILSQEVNKNIVGNVENDLTLKENILKEFEVLNKTSFKKLLENVRHIISPQADLTREITTEACMEVLMVMLDISGNHATHEDRVQLLQTYFSNKNINSIIEATIAFLNGLDIEKLKMLRQKMIDTFKNNEKLFGSNLIYHPQTKLDAEVFPLSLLVREVVQKEESNEEQIDFLIMSLMEGLKVDYDYDEFKTFTMHLVSSGVSRQEVKQQMKEICGGNVDVIIDNICSLVQCKRGDARTQDGKEQDKKTDKQYFEDMKNKREEQLKSKKTAPKGIRDAQKEQYPFVFDSLKTVTSSAAFIAGCKLMLPEEAKRVDEEKYEKVSIAASASSRNKHQHNLVLCSELDELSQRAFKGTKSLNLIQSMVYQAASFSNENLLICAPTGAGKTNIAMLTVMREVRNNMEDGVIKMDAFKIIYIAPMKALAAEVVSNFGNRLSSLGLQVRELTGDMQLSKSDIANTQLIVTTPEKWDVITRKNTGDGSVARLVKVLIIDEIHLLHDDRGSVIESIVSRTLRQVETSQTMIRIVGLSATLPNYIDVARFLKVNPYTGLFFFDESFRPVPLDKTFIGIKATNYRKQLSDMAEVAYEEVIRQVKQGHQVMVFVHARNETVRTAEGMVEMAEVKGEGEWFVPADAAKKSEIEKTAMRCNSVPLRKLMGKGFAVHHAGLLRPDRKQVERCFAEGHLKVIVCTATLAWGVNLPAHAVVIKGTQIYDVKRGQFSDLGILDVLQIFGRAGRPQYDTTGQGTIITTHDKLPHYLSLLTLQSAIESQFISDLSNHLNAEISLGTVTSVEEAVQWLKYTYMYVRMHINPLNYGLIPAKMHTNSIMEHLTDLVISSAKNLDKARMIRFDEATKVFYATDLGRTASHYYIKSDTIEVVNEMFVESMDVDKLLLMLSSAKEFEQIKVRDEEGQEMDEHLNNSCQFAVGGGAEAAHGKVNILLQSYISRSILKAFSLVSDQAYVVDNASRILRALFEVALHKGWPLVASRLLRLSKMVDNRMWWWQSPLRQFAELPLDAVYKVESKGLSIEKLREMDVKEIGQMIRNNRVSSSVLKSCMQLPNLLISTTLQPITRTILKVSVSLTPDFQWNNNVHGKTSEPFWIWVEDPISDHIYHYEYVTLLKKNVVTKTSHNLTFSIPIFEPLPSQYLLRVASDKWLGSEMTHALSFKHLILPDRHPPHTELLDLQPLPKEALKNPALEQLYSFSHFNPVQTQIFHALYHNDCNVLLGAPTGSGKTVAAELAIFRVFQQQPSCKAVYIAPLKALVRERVDDWKVRIESKLGKKVVELTGDAQPDMRAVVESDVIVTTPEKWDGLSRSWQSRRYVTSVALIVIDEIHLLGDERGPVLEVIVSRSNFISSHTDQKIRIVGLSTALANAHDLANWLSITPMGLFNFRPSVRPVPLEVHISGFPGKFYCPRMSSMNKPAFLAIQTYSPSKPAIIFVSSRRQTRLTALELIAFLAASDHPKQWLHISENDITSISSKVKESTLKLTLTFGIGMHHAGLHESDRRVVEELFVNQKIQVIICTSTLAWGVNFPAHLVVVKGTEFYDGKLKRYVDFPITDILQMMGRAGRPQFDDQGVAAILVHDKKKHFYKKFLYEPFPVESSLLGVLSEHLNAELVAGTIATKQEAIDYVTWTFFFRRLLINPSYYDLQEVDVEHINKYLSRLVEKCVYELQQSVCVCVEEDSMTLTSTFEGRICSYYYLHHFTMLHFKNNLTKRISIAQLLRVLADCHEFSTLPVRHNEDNLNKELSTHLPIPINNASFDNSNTKTFLLLQAYLCNEALPCTDYNTDTKSVLDQAMRVIQAMIDYSGEKDNLQTCISSVLLQQMIVQGRWIHYNSLYFLPHSNHHDVIGCFRKPVSRHGKVICSKEEISTLAELLVYLNGDFSVLKLMLETKLDYSQLQELHRHLCNYPLLKVDVALKKEDSTPILLSPAGGVVGCYTEVKAGEEYVLMVDLLKLNKPTNKNGEVQTNKYPKQKQEGWVLILGDIRTDQVVALKRVPFFHRKKNVLLSFDAPETRGKYVYTLYVLSDSYLELDQQFNVLLQAV